MYGFKCASSLNANACRRYCEDLAAAHAREQTVAGGLEEFRDRQAALTAELRRAVAMEESLELATERLATMEAEVEAAKVGRRRKFELCFDPWGLKGVRFQIVKGVNLKLVSNS